MNNSARLPAKLTCSEGAEKAIQEPTIEEIGHSGQEETHTREKSKICESCLAVSKISAEVEICLQTIVSEYEMELKRLRDRLDSLSAIYRNPRLNVNTACSAGLVARTGSETCDCHLYRNIPGFKDEMRKLGDKNSVNSKDSAIMYYEAAALNGCAESCFKVAMYSLNLDSPESEDYIKAKVLILVIRICRALSFFLSLLHSLHRNFWRGRRDSGGGGSRPDSRGSRPARGCGCGIPTSAPEVRDVVQPEARWPEHRWPATAAESTRQRVICGASCIVAVARHAIK